MGMSSPSHYNSIDLDKHKASSPKYDWTKTKTVRIQPLKKTPAGQAEVSPHAYKADASLDAIQTSSPRYSYGREKGKSFIETYR
jgi:hypothetical protein